MDPFSQAVIIFLCLALGGVLKGATGAGIGLIAIPIMAILVDVQFALLVMLVPNLLTNLWQAWHYHRDRLPGSLALVLALSGGAGVLGGSYLLATLSERLLMLCLAISVFLYLGLRLSRPGARLPMWAARRLSIPIGLIAGTMQGMSGISAPVSLAFVNALGLPRPAFIHTVSVFFTIMSLAQFLGLGLTGILTPHALLLSIYALLPVTLSIPIGARLARKMSRETFDRVVMGVLAVLGAKLLFDVLGG